LTVVPAPRYHINLNVYIIAQNVPCLTEPAFRKANSEPKYRGDTCGGIIVHKHLTLAVTVTLAVALGCGSTQTKQDSTKKEKGGKPAAEQKTEQKERQEEPTNRVAPGSAPSYEAVSLDKGQTLSSLARNHDVTVKQILAANEHIEDPKSIPVGKPIFIPTGQTSEEQTSQKAEAKEGAGGSTDSAEEAKKSTSAETVKPKDVSPADLHRGQGDARFWWPTSGEVVRKFGKIFRSSRNPGLGIAAPAGQEVCSIADGTVQVSRDTSSKGDRQWEHVVVIKHDNNFESWYGLLSSTTVEKDQKVEKGQRIGLVSPRGIDGQPQLEFRLYRNGQKVDPTEYLP